MGLTRQQFLGGLADPFGAAAAHEHAVVQEEPQQAQVGIAQVATQEEGRGSSQGSTFAIGVPRLRSPSPRAFQSRDADHESGTLT